MTNNSKSKAKTSLKKAKSLLSKILEMIEREEECMDILQQNLAVMGLLRSAHKTLMEHHLKECFCEALDSADEEYKEELTGEILKVIDLYNRG